MNYLAHAYLSFNNEEVLLGNMISDFVKGKQQFLYPPVIHKGILLHRAIDDFTDFHPVTQNAKSVFREAYRLYSGAFVDVVYDHFLALDEEAFPDDALQQFAQKTYAAMHAQTEWMPERYKRMFYYMHTQNWLYGYKTMQGIHHSFGGLVKRAAYLQDSLPAIDIFEKEYNFLKNCYNQFWPHLKAFAFEKYTELIKDL